ncbi:MAG TPA: hypothetical protein VEO74_12880, partial [Thermoanaerobaculia bacterium]|nr:hypothetical protein [Thermoanaerobaculia bacterium]
DVGFRPVLRDALRRGQRPIYIQGDDRYVHACWFGAQMGAAPKTFVALGDWPPPPHALVIGEKACAGCEVISSHAPVVAYSTP